ncbi:MAG TPA: hypothetical protein VMU47_08855, partial [Caldimonas sp.]|nr:hypothetical protein [Caldimonas sp.]
SDHLPAQRIPLRQPIEEQHGLSLNAQPRHVTETSPKPQAIASKACMPEGLDVSANCRHKP